MANFTYTIRAGTASHPGYPTFNAAVADFAANNRCGAGTNTVGASDVLTFKVQGFLDFTSTDQTISGITVTAGGQIIVEADTNPFNASSSTALRYVETFDGFKFGTTAKFTINQANHIVRNLVIASGVGGGSGSIASTGTSGARGLIQSCLIHNTSVNFYYTVAAYLNNSDVRNCVVITKSDNSGGALRAVLTDTDCTIEQSTIVNLATSGATSYGIYQNGGTNVTVKNTYVGGFTAFGSFAGSSGSVGNSADGTDTPENNTALESVALSTTNFENVTAGSEDLRVKSTSALKTTGATRLSSTLTDIFGTSRATTATVGAFEFSSGGSSIAAISNYYRMMRSA